MVDQEDQVENDEKEDEELDNIIVVPKIEGDDGSEPATTLFAVRTLYRNN